MLSRERIGRIGFFLGGDRTKSSRHAGSDSACFGERSVKTVGREGRHVAGSGGQCALAASAHACRQADAERRNATTLHVARDRDEHSAVDEQKRNQRSLI